MKAQDPRLYPTPAEIGQKAAEPCVMSAADIGILPSNKGNLHCMSFWSTRDFSTSRTEPLQLLPTKMILVCYARQACKSMLKGLDKIPPGAHNKLPGLCRRNSKNLL